MDNGEGLEIRGARTDPADLCGTAAFLKDRVIVPEVATEGNWPDQFRDLAVIVATA